LLRSNDDVTRIPFVAAHCATMFTVPSPAVAASLRARPTPARASRRRALTVAAESGSIRREVLDRAGRGKLNTADDRAFYATPRLCTHVDDAFLGQLTELYRQKIPPGGTVFDVCSSWISHLPEDVRYERVVGHGMNAEELEKNPRLDAFFVKNLNTEAIRFAVAEKSFDAVLCCVSVQYLQKPEEVFAEVYRVLKPGGCFIVSFSNRMFYEKALASWRDGTGYSRALLVKDYFGAVDGFTKPEVITDVSGAPDVSLIGKVRNFLRRTRGDPFYAVVAHRNFKPIDQTSDRRSV